MAVARPAADRRDARRASALVVALLLACLYAAFADGGVGLPEETRVQVALAAIGVWAAALWLAAGSLRLVAPRLAWIGVGLLVAFAAWSALSLFWSIQPDRTWQAANRTLAYALVVVLALAAGASAPRAIERVAVGWLLVAVLVATYAFAGKAVPGLDLPLVDLDHAADLARLRAPLGYWNALGLLCAMAMPVALRLAADDALAPRWRLAAAAALFELGIVLGMTYSRGGVLALLVAVAIVLAAGPDRLRILSLVVLTSLATVPVLGVAYTRDGLTVNAAPLDLRMDDGRVLLAVFLVCLAALLWSIHRLAREEHRVVWTPAMSRLAWRGIAVAGSTVALVGVLGLAAGDQGTKVVVEDAVASFDKPADAEAFDPGRLASTDSSNRVGWWKEALGAWSDRPVAGYGAGSFPLVHKRYRQDTIPVRQPHSVPLQFLSETGLIGALLGLGALAALAAAGARRVRELAAGRRQDLAVALLALSAAYLVHACVDWDWDIPGVTLPALVALGVVAGGGGRARRAEGPVFRDVDRERRPPVASAAGLVAACLLLTAFAVSAILPAWADSKATSAQASVSARADAEELRRAAAEAELAARLDPLAVRPLFVLASIAEGRDRLLDARRHLLDAAGRQPDDPEVWLRLAGIATQLADADGFRDAARRFGRLDPANPGARSLGQDAEAALAPPNASATAVGTPLPLAVQQQPPAAPSATPAPTPPAVTPQTAIPNQGTPFAVAPPPE
ncbi:MAG TPA: O-antigen ligase family protein [Baekduia sp.]|nr:O-antigen ligase family protein [Baekduia sp.]